MASSATIETQIRGGPAYVTLASRLFALGLCALCLGCLAPSRIFGQGPPAARSPAARSIVEAGLRAKLEKPGDLTLRNTRISDALLTISELWEINLVGDDELEGAVSGVFKQTPLYEILDSILLSGGYSYRPVGQSLVVMRLEDMGDVNPLFQYARIALRRLAPEDVAPLAERVASPRGTVQAVPSARSLVIFDYPDRVAMIRQMVEELDAAGTIAGTEGEQDAGPLSVTHVQPQYSQVINLAPALQAVLSDVGKIGVVEAENKIVVVDYPDRLELVRSVVERLDVPRGQVRITALIYDISLEDIEQLGINFNEALKGPIDAEGTPQSLFAIDSITTVPLDSGAASGVMTLSRLGSEFDITAVVQALQTARDARLLADPSVMVLDNERASISLISEIPYQQLTQTGQGGDIGTTGFKEAGIKLNVIPQIASDGTIQMVVEPEFSRLTGFTPEEGQPIIDRRTAQTRVRVANGQTLVIGGLRQRADLGQFNGIPYLKDMKYIGKLFRGRESTVRESELVVFIRPEIVTANQPLNWREHAALDTTIFRLDEVPIGDSYPLGGHYHNGPVYGPELGPAPAGHEPAGAEGALPTPGEYEYDLIHPAGAPSPALDTAIYPPSSPEYIPSLAPRGLGASLVLADSRQIFPLPPVDDSPRSLPATILAAGAEEAPGPAPLRPAFDERFRATGGIYHNAQRTEEPAAIARRQAEAAAARQPQSQTFWDKLWRF